MTAQFTMFDQMMLQDLSASTSSPASADGTTPSISPTGGDGALQLAINDVNGGFRLAGPKYDGSGKTVLKHSLSLRDIEELEDYLARARKELSAPGPSETLSPDSARADREALIDLIYAIITNPHKKAGVMVQEIQALLSKGGGTTEGSQG